MSRNLVVLFLACMIGTLSCRVCAAANPWDSYTRQGQRAFDQKDYASAERMFASAIKESDKFSVNDPRRLEARRRLVQVYYAQGRYADAQPLFLQLLQELEHMIGQDHPVAISAWTNYAKLLRKLDRMPEAVIIEARTNKIRAQAALKEAALKAEEEANKVKQAHQEELEKERHDKQVALVKPVRKTYEDIKSGHRSTAQDEPIDNVDTRASRRHNATDIRASSKIVRGARVSLANRKVAEEMLARLGQMPELKELNLHGADFNDKDLTYLKDLYGLRDLDVSYTRLGGSGVKLLSSLIGLRSLAMHGTGVDDNGLALLAKLANLRRLELRGMAGITDKGLAMVQNLPQLEYLDISQTKASDNALKNLSQLKSLTELNISGAQVTDAGISHLRNLTKLEVLKADNISATGVGLGDLTHCRNLRVLSLRGSAITDDGMKQFPAMLALDELDLTDTRITDDALKNLKGCHKLRNLILTGTQITGHGLGALKTMTNLQYLMLNKSKIDDHGLSFLADLTQLRTLDLSDTQISSRGVTLIENLPNLRVLILNNTRITDNVVDSLCRLSSLRSLSLERTGLSQDAVDAIQKAVPEVSINYEKR